MPRKRYALYDTFAANIPERALAAPERRELEQGLAQLDGAEQQAVLLLIYEHYLTETKADELGDRELAALPYGGKELANSARPGAAFDLAAIPTALKWVLLKFVRQRLQAGTRAGPKLSAQS